MVPQAVAQAAGGPAPQVALGLRAGGDAVDGRRLRPGEEVEGGCSQEGRQGVSVAVLRRALAHTAVRGSIRTPSEGFGF